MSLTLRHFFDGPEREKETVLEFATFLAPPQVVFWHRDSLFSSHGSFNIQSMILATAQTVFSPGLQTC